jgi:hypothetical protein
MDVMKNFFWVMVSCLLLLPLSCGGGSSSGGTSQTSGSPAISTFSIFPNQASLNQGGGTINVTMSFYFIAFNLDLSTVTVFLIDPNGKRTNFDPVASGKNGVYEDQIRLNYPQPTSIRGTWTVGVFVTDGSGRNSNQQTTTFTVS